MSSFRRILQFIKPYKYLVIISLVASLVFAVMNGTSVWMVGTLMDKIISSNSGEFSDIVKDVPDENFNQILKNWTEKLIGNESPIGQLKNLCIWLLLIFFIKNIFFYINNVVLAFIQNKIITDIRNKLFIHLNNLPISYFDKNKSAEIQTIMIRDVQAMRTAFSQSIQRLIVEPISIIMFIILLFIISIKMTFIALIIIPISGIVIAKLGKSIRRKAKRSSIQIAGVSDILQETISGIRIVKAFAMEKFEIQRFTKENLKFFHLVFRQAKLTFLSTPINEMVAVIIGMVLLWIGGVAVLEGRGINHDDFMRFILLLFALMQPAKKLGNVNAQIQVGLASADRVFQILDVEISIEDKADAKTIIKFQDEIKFNDVTFKYETGTSPSLKNINCNIRKGEVVALVGRSGAGKSTFVDLIPRFYDMTNGFISIDGQDIKDISLKSLRSLMGIVTQETILFNDTIANNISYGKPSASADEIISASKTANAFDFISDLPSGFDTMVGEKGSRLSGGQRQRISIARAILKNPAILIFDEATSALDTESEQKVQNAIDNLVLNKTVIMVAHRLSTIRKADKIIVFDNGHIMESGTHESLMATGEIYKQFYIMQFADTAS
ncbi:MAG: ABC transporter ATP-binding protein [Candidatus Marinimicrobia bacterium]|jgi:subfamily B ATP-binding cassette protein MsbA|nr:ABC transporter ATP-binding protein [Candidatus Neomarinimicrobiota bacterium]MBT3633911.1 ABC transporter ATP-binding protein [Candidatus Neomarinimicrobiota bacterium]MBT3682839.1 ABC transporter ATP-binding protein [Candidatus Neomarinimicrobiota bacterium]MBT3759974.1 ABC transporter ATP-binding protein [Candidatus Neomarinimicrobiota bacterium]MBT3896068.1 ABC transporter ATP-binding protein [Candidatus Neomarinimicrobiota bacterium]